MGLMTLGELAGVDSSTSVYLKRCAQSAGPEAPSNNTQHIKANKKIKSKDILFKAFLDPLWESLFLIFRPFLESLLLPWRHFWSTLASFFVLKTRLWRRRCPRSAHPRNKVTFWDPSWGPFLQIFAFCRSKKRGCKTCACKGAFSDDFLTPLNLLGRVLARVPARFSHIRLSAKNYKKRVKLGPILGAIFL